MLIRGFMMQLEASNQTRIANTSPSQQFEFNVNNANGSQATVRVCVMGVAYDVRESIFHDKHRIMHLPTVEAVKDEAARMRAGGCHIVVLPPGWLHMS